jgi:hypothetical protein
MAGGRHLEIHRVNDENRATAHDLGILADQAAKPVPISLV